MSLLMQALKKAERARQSGLQEDGPGHDEPAPEPQEPAAGLPERAAPRTPSAGAGGLELSLEPLDGQPPPRPAPAMPSPPPIEPAIEATHNPVPPQARHDGAGARAEGGEIPVSDARAVPHPAAEAAARRRAPGDPDRRAIPRAATTRADEASGLDMGKLRLYGLAGILVIVAGTFIFLYREALTGPGPGASLPMVPMPPPSATGATSAGADGGIVVAPAGPPFGPTADALAERAPGTGEVPATLAPPPAVAAQPEAAGPGSPATPTTPATPSATPARTGGARGALAAGPTAAQLASIEDPQTRELAMQDAAERAERAERAGVTPDLPPPAPGRASASSPAAPSGAPPAAPYMAAGDSAADVRVTRGAVAATINPGVQAGYAAFGAGDLATARQQYGAALRQDPNNRDALLGAAAVAAREGRDEEAASWYNRLLAVNPRDAEAVAGLAALRPGDGERAELRLKNALRTNPDAGPVHFSLGNLYARQGRWQEAQQAYFRAWSAVPGNADYAFNLAVGLDRLNQGRLARDYYQRALALASGSPAAFDPAAVRRRLLELAPAVPAPSSAPAPAPAPASMPAPAPLAVPGSAGN